MEEKKKMAGWKKALIIIFSIILSFVVIFVAIFAFLKIKYNVNIISTVKSVKILSEKVDEDAKFKNKFSDDNKASVRTKVNAEVGSYILYNLDDGYTISNITSSDFTNGLKLSDKEVAAFFDIIQNDSENEFSFSLAGTSVPLSLIQIAFSNLDGNKVDVNFVVKADISSLKDGMDDFPLSLLAKYISEALYLSTTVTVEKGEGTFNYTVSGKSFSVNNLSDKQTEELFALVNMISKSGDAKSFGLTLGESFANGIIGNSENTGMVYSFNGCGISDFRFENDGNEIKLVFVHNV